MTESQPGIRYRLVPLDPAAHLFEITCTVTRPAADGQVFRLPAWTPGSYMIRDFSRHWVRVSARCGERDISLTKLDKHSWRAAACNGELSLRAEVYAWDLSVRGAYLDQTRGFFDGASLFPRVLGRDREPCSVDLLPPREDVAADWRLATSMSRDGAEPFGFGRYRAEDYEDLIDHPVEMGDFSSHSFDVEGVPHHLVIAGRHRCDMSRLAADLARICAQHQRFFGLPAPMREYWFLVMAVGDGYGGLEHRASTSLLCSRDDLPLPGQADIGDSYRGFLALCSHEYFHTWNVKRIKPACFMPYALERETHTSLLWAFEGITSYLDDLGLVRSGVIDTDSYLELLGRVITRVLKGAGRHKQSVADSSFDAWTKFYRQDENAPNAIVSYYTKGALVALCLDLLLRRDSEDACSLDDIMRELWARFGSTGVGVEEQEWERLAEQVSGLDLSKFFEQALRGSEDLPLAELLQGVGLKFELRRAASQEDRGGKPAEVASRMVLGARCLGSDGGLKLSHVFDGGAARRAGLSAGDILLAVDGLKVATVEKLEKTLAGYAPGSRVPVHAFRRDELMLFELQMQDAPLDTCVLSLDPDAPDGAVRRREAWLAAN